jgi:hypothetical protein
VLIGSFVATTTASYRRLGGAHEDDDPTLRGNYRVVHNGGLRDDETAEELALAASNP